MKLYQKVKSFQSSPHTGRALTLVKVLNFVGTVRGAVTTVLLAASVLGGGTATVQAVRKEIAEAPPARTNARTQPPTPSPTRQTAASIFADIKTRLDATLAADAQAAEDVRKVAVFSGDRLDQLVSETRQKLQARYDLGITQLQALLGLGPTPSPTGSPSPTPSLSPSPPSIISANALATVITNDLSAIVVLETRSATEPTPVPRPASATPAPPQTPAPKTPVPPTPVPTPTHSASPTARPTPTR